MLLIADSGSTKTDWALAESGKGIVSVQHTVGYNPYFIDSESIYQSLTENLVKNLKNPVDRIFFYGAGCSTPEKKGIVRSALMKAFPGVQEIFVGHDLLASARALLGREKGFAAILGTGANTCIYDGQDCVMNIDSLGYLLGDEGSASYIGKKLVRDFMRKQLEPALQQRFAERFGIESNEQILKTLYSTDFPNRYLAGFCSFTDEFADHPYVKAKVGDAFRDFFKNLVSRYPDYQSFSFNCVGSVAYVFRDILAETAGKYGMKMGKVIRSPLDDLVAYHIGS